MKNLWAVLLISCLALGLAACDQAPAEDPSSATPPAGNPGGLVPPPATPTPDGGGLVPPGPTPVTGATAGEGTSSGKTIVKFSPGRISGQGTMTALEGNFTTTYHSSSGTAVGIDMTFSATAAQ